MTIRSSRVIRADKTHRYWELTRLVAEARHVMPSLHDELVQAICADGEPICVEQYRCCMSSIGGRAAWKT
jgi:hypothetical protein